MSKAYSYSLASGLGTYPGVPATASVSVNVWGDAFVVRIDMLQAVGQRDAPVFELKGEQAVVYKDIGVGNDIQAGVAGRAGNMWRVPACCSGRAE